MYINNIYHIILSLQFTIDVQAVLNMHDMAL